MYISLLPIVGYFILGMLVARAVFVSYVNKCCDCDEIERSGKHSNSCYASIDRVPVALLSLLLWPFAVFIPIFLFITRPTLREKTLATRVRLKEMEKEVEKLKKEYNL